MSHTHIVAITGGIGSGKSFVCQKLRERGIDVYDCDAAAKKLLHNDPALQQQLMSLVGKTLYQEGRLCKQVLSQYILQSEAHAQQIDNIVHPAVAQDFFRSGKNWLESAIYFSSNFDQRVPATHVIAVVAPLDVRLQRIVQRDNTTPQQAMQWMNRQWKQEVIVQKATFVIQNDGIVDLDSQITAILKQIYSPIKS